jgi:hypothetical protein
VQICQNASTPLRTFTFSYQPLKWVLWISSLTKIISLKKWIIDLLPKFTHCFLLFLNFRCIVRLSPSDNSDFYSTFQPDKILLHYYKSSCNWVLYYYLFDILPLLYCKNKTGLFQGKPTVSIYQVEFQCIYLHVHSNRKTFVDNLVKKVLVAKYPSQAK